MAVPTGWVTVARWQVVLRGAALSILGQAGMAPAEEQLKVAAARRQLQELGFELFLEFPVNVSGSISAPERRAMEAVNLA